MPKSIPSRNEIAAVLDGSNFVVVQWGGVRPATRAIVRLLL